MLLKFPQSFYILDQEHDDYLDWRRVKFELTHNLVSYASFKVRRKAGGRCPHALSQSAIFRASLDRLIKDVLKISIPEAEHTITTGGNYGYFNDGKSSPILSLKLSSWAHDKIGALASHGQFALLHDSKAVAKRYKAKHQAGVR